MFNFNISSFFGGGSSSGSSGLFGSINLSDYRMIKSGSYKKLMKAYYADQKSTTSSKSDKSVVKKLAEANNAKDTTGVSKMKTQSDSLKTAAEAFNKADDFKQKDGSYDMDKVAKSVNDFVNKYNSAIDQAGKTTSKEVDTQIGYMKRMTSTMSSSLAKVGITVGADGKMTLNEDTLKNASEKDLKAMFFGAHSYADEIADKAASVGSAALRSSSVYSSNGSWSNSSSSIFNNWV